MSSIARSTARPAATLVILRDGPDGLEVLLTLRPRHFRFMGGAAVFPGGAVDEHDLDPRWAAASKRSAAGAAAALEMEDGDRALAFFICALRESWEEVGFVVGDGPLERLRRDDARDGALLRRCLEHGIKLATDRLVPVARWVTPPSSELRFDTRFFLARAPERWAAHPHEVELDGCAWRAPRSALRDFRGGRLDMAPPTVDVLTRLAPFTSVDLALAAAARGSLGGSARVPSARLSPLVGVVLAPNPGLLTGPGTNSYVVGRDTTVVIDPAVSDVGYLDSLCNSAGDVLAIVVTHRHPDHVGGVAALVERTGAPVRAFGASLVDGVPAAPLVDGEELEAPGATLRALYTPGHARDHLSLVLEEERALFSGDNVLGEGTSMIAPPDGDMRLYLASLQRLQSLGLDRVYPGHFGPLDGAGDVLQRYIEHRKQREAEILDAVGSGAGTVEEIVAAVYAGTPEELRRVAAGSVRAHLAMLAQDGRVARRGSLWTRERS